MLPSGELINQHLRVEEMPVTQPKFYGHEPRVTIPSQQLFIGCVFYIMHYEKAESLKKVVQKAGGECEEEHNARCTHIICEHQNNAIVQQVSEIFWFSDVIN